MASTTSFSSLSSSLSPPNKEATRLTSRNDTSAPDTSGRQVMKYQLMGLVLCVSYLETKDGVRCNLRPAPPGRSLLTAREVRGHEKLAVVLRERDGRERPVVREDDAKRRGVKENRKMEEKGERDREVMRKVEVDRKDKSVKAVVCRDSEGRLVKMKTNNNGAFFAQFVKVESKPTKRVGRPITNSSSDGLDTIVSGKSNTPTTSGDVNTSDPTVNPEFKSIKTPDPEKIVEPTVKTVKPSTTTKRKASEEPKTTINQLIDEHPKRRKISLTEYTRRKSRISQDAINTR